MTTYYPEHPLILGLCGEAGVGKSATAALLTVPASVQISDGEGNSSSQSPIYWEHLYFALPLYRMATARQTIQGENAFSRQCHELHAVVLEVFGRALEYDELVDAVYEIATYPCPEEGKPRGFLQHVGTEICRALDPDCWVKWMRYKILSDYRAYVREQTRTEELWELEFPDEPFSCPTWGVVVSDVRFANEAEMIASQPNGYLVKLTCDPEVRLERLRTRDGDSLDPTQSSHSSETSVELINPELFDLVLDTTSLLLSEQTTAVINVIQGDFVAVH